MQLIFFDCDKSIEGYEKICQFTWTVDIQSPPFASKREVEYKLCYWLNQNTNGFVFVDNPETFLIEVAFRELSDALKFRMTFDRCKLP